jgi:hypothetical protein
MRSALLIELILLLYNCTVGKILSIEQHYMVTPCIIKVKESMNPHGTLQQWCR